MLLKSYTKEIFRPECNPQFQSIHCFAHLEQDISGVLPYLNTVLGGSGYTTDPPSLMLQIHGGPDGYWANTFEPDLVLLSPHNEADFLALLGAWGAAGAALLATLSPAMVFYSRYYIHETLLVLFSMPWGGKPLIWLSSHF